MTEREKIEILQKKAEIPEVVRKKMQLAYGQIRQEKRMHEEIEGQKNERGKLQFRKRKWLSFWQLLPFLWQRYLWQPGYISGGRMD